LSTYQGNIRRDMSNTIKSAFSAVLLSMLIVFSAKAALPMAVEGQPLPSLAPMIERVQASLVSISIQARVQARRDPFDDPFFRRFFDQRRAARNREVFATGVVVDALQGLILTNEHSVRGASLIKITLSDGRVVEGEVIGTDANTDIALIKTNVVGLSAIALGDSSSLRVGDFVVSIGDPLGDQNTIISGIVSGLARQNSLQAHEHFIQSDAAIGPGVLVDLNGDLIGLNIAKSAQTASSTRIGFSTPINLALRVKNQLVKYGTPQRGFLAVQVQDLTPDLANAFDIQQRGGAVVTSVTPGSSAEDAGILVGDVILEAGTQSINRSNDLRSVIGQQFAGDELAMMVARQGNRLSLQPVLESSTLASKKGTMIHHQLEGATLKEIDTRQVSTNLEDGVLVSAVKKGSVAWNHGVRANDIIVSANRKSVRNLDTFREAINGQDVLMLNIVRGNGALFLLLQ